jgi:simple sugar transport system permease protein
MYYPRKVLGIRELYVVLSAIAMIILFGYINPRFFSGEALYSILTLATELGIITLGVSFLMIAGEFDLSVGSVYAFSGLITIWALNNGLSYPASLSLSLAFALTIGVINGVITTYGRIPSFITTLGMMWLLRGLLLAITGGFPIGLERLPPEMVIYTYQVIGDLRASSVWFLALILILQIVLSNTPYGNRAQAVGGSPGVARALGVRVERVKMLAFIISSLCAAISGQVAVARFKIVEPTAGAGLELEAIAASVLGGTSLTGGIGSIVGAALGALLVGIIRVGLIFAGAPAYWYIGFIGFLLIVVGVISLRRGRTA